MGEIINFPNNYNHLIEKATKLYEENEYVESIALYNEAYDLKPSLKLNKIISLIYLENEEPELALDKIQDYIDSYESIDEYKLLYVSILIDNKDFKKSQMMIGEELNENLESHRLEEWKSLESHLYKMIKEEEKKLSEFKRRTKEKLYSLINYTVEEQLSIVKDAKILDLETLKEAARVLFINPYIHHFSRIGILEYLIQNNVRDTYEFLWLEETRKITPTELEIFEKNKTVNKIEKLVQKYLEKNPSLYELINTEMTYHLMHLFPFIEQVVTDEEKWVDIYLTKYSETAYPPKNDEETKIMEKWLDCLNNYEYFQ